MSDHHDKKSRRHGGEPKPARNWVFAAIMGLLGSYFAASLLGWPQAGTAMTNAAAHHEAVAEEVPAAAVVKHDKFHPPYYMVLPFCLLLAAIALFPLIHATEHFWENNLNKFYIAGGLAAATLAYYVFAFGHPLDRHFLGHAVIEPAGTPSWNLGWVVIQNAILNDFVPFIILLFALYTISGGIRISGDLPAHPSTNTAFLTVGAVLASFIGTTGAAMLLIRPVLETNSERKHVAHTVVFFIFIVCNCGGCLLPIGDPPLFLGYLQGVDFLWTLGLWKQWALVNGLLLVIYFLADTLIAYPREERRDVRRDETRVRGMKFEGLMPNALLLIGIVFAAALLSPTKPFPGTHWYPWLFLREAAQLGLVALSLAIGSPRVREENKFSYGAIVEVAALFVGIFICMQPALQILDVNGPTLGINTTTRFFWFTGALSSVLDNAPTYLVFFETAKTLPDRGVAEMAGVAVDHLTAISLGAVFMGANTYIGNGPNFMVKTIAEKSGIKMPSFFGYMVYSFAILIPLFVLVTFIFFWGYEAQDVRAAIISKQAELEAFCARLRTADRIGFDTEFVSEFTYKPQLCLVQVATADEAFCIDTLAPLDLTPLWNELTDPAHEIIAHAARQELLFALDATQRRLARLFDVQIAAGMIGMEFPAGYGNLIARLLGEKPQKGETRTDWRRRPLTDRQIEYALADVKHLLPLHDVLRGRLAELKRSSWFADEIETFQADIEASLTKERWRRVSGSAGLSARSQAVLRELWQWRESEAERRDLPPRLVLRDDLLVEMSKRRDADPKHLGAIRGMERPEIRRAIPEFARLIERALKLPEEVCPPIVRTDTNPQLSMLGQFLTSALSSICRGADIAPSIVGTPNDVRELVNYRLNGVFDSEGNVPTLARGWRAEVVGHLIEDLLAGRASIRIANPNSEHPLVIEPRKA